MRGALNIAGNLVLIDQKARQGPSVGRPHAIHDDRRPDGLLSCFRRNLRVQRALRAAMSGRERSRNCQNKDRTREAPSPPDKGQSLQASSLAALLLFGGRVRCQ